MERAYIYMQLPDSDEVVSLGALMVDQGRGSFVYNPAYAAQAGAWVPDAFNYALRRQPYPAIQTNAGIPGFIRDAAPDGWGQIVLNKVERGELSAIQYLLKSPNHDRAGNLMAGTTPKPPRGVGQAGIQRITHLEDFIAWADSVQGEKPPNVDLTTRAAMQQRSSLGGARPKMTLRDGKRLILAKPRDRHDIHDTPSVEHACMAFAAQVGLNVAPTTLYRGSKNVLMVERFDRGFINDSFRRIPMLSGLSLVDGDWIGNDRSRWRYATIANEMKRRDVPVGDLREFYKRMVFNVLVGNSDDHPKNTSVLWQEGGWRLSPAYDLVPDLYGESPAYSAMSVGPEGRKTTRVNLLGDAQHFGLTTEEAIRVLDTMAGYEEALCDHYRDLLADDEADLAIAAIGAFRLRG